MLQPLMNLVRNTCEELQSSTFSILFHPIKEQLTTVDSANMLGKFSTYLIGWAQDSCQAPKLIPGHPLA